MEMAQKRMMVQIPWRLLILIGIPVRVMANVGDRGAMRCCVVCLIGALTQGIGIVATDRHYGALRFNQCLHRHLPSADRANRTGASAVRTGTVDGLPEEVHVRSRAETRASIAQNLGGRE